MTDKYPIAEVKTTRIVCLEAPLSSAREVHHRDRLYLFAEVIDTIEISGRYWVRPLALARSNPESWLSRQYGENRVKLYSAKLIDTETN